MLYPEFDLVDYYHTLSFFIKREAGRKNMRFLKNNSYDIVRLYVNQIGIAIFSMVLNIAVNSMGEESFSLGLTIAISIFSAIFYCSLLYNVSWEYGAKDKIRADANKIEYNGTKGLLMGLIAAIPNVLLTSLALVFGFVYKLSNLDFAAVISGIANFFMRLSLSMYHGIIDSIFGGFSSVSDASFLGAAAAYLLASGIAVAVTHIGYILGSREYKIFAFLSSKK